MKLAKRTRIVLVIVGLLVALGAGTVFVGFRATSHATETAALGRPVSSTEMEAQLDAPGPIAVETIVAADWEVDRSGLINLSNPVAKQEHLEDGPEPIQIYFHVLRHPTRGTFLVDTGIEHALVADPEHAAIRGPVVHFMHMDKMHVRTETAAWIATEPQPLAGVFLTHMHLDHISGMRDVPHGTPIFVGPNEAEDRSFLNVVAAPNVDRALEGQRALSEWGFRPDRDGRFAGVLDVFGDGTLFAIWVPGHTRGSTAYLARTPNGPVLLAGDTCHTEWGWDHDVEPGSFTANRDENARSLHALRELVRRHPSIDVRLGHQPLHSAKSEEQPTAVR